MTTTFGLFVLSIFIMLSIPLYLIKEFYRIFLIGKIERLEDRILMLKEEFEQKDFDNIEEADEWFDEILDRCRISYTTKNIKIFKKKLLLLCLTFFMTSLIAGKTYPIAKKQGLTIFSLK